MALSVPEAWTTQNYKIKTIYDQQPPPSGQFHLKKMVVRGEEGVKRRKTDEKDEDEKCV